MTTGCPRWKRFHQHLLAVYCTIAVLASAQDCECIVRPLGWPNSTEISCANYGMPSVDGTCCEWYSDNADNTGCQHLCVHSLQVMRRAATSHGVAKLVYVISCKRFDDASVSAFAYVAALVVVPIAVCCIGVTVTKRHQSQQSQGGEKEALGHGFVRVYIHIDILFCDRVLHFTISSARQCHQQTVELKRCADSKSPIGSGQTRQRRRLWQPTQYSCLKCSSVAPLTLRSVRSSDPTLSSTSWHVSVPKYIQ